MGLFSGTAPYYARFRPGYPQAFFSDVITRFALNGTGRSLDLGCGTGQLTIPLAGHVEQAVGLDPDPGMLAQAAQQARAAGARNLTWIQGDAADLAGELGRWRRLLGDRRPAFERDLTTALLTAVPTGRFTEPVTLKVLIARRPP
ncbi:class I SAM-dependent methyltransferase [Nonomuraea fuscirosea]|uniref:class I SAM-dependent methyltransferase n=1 Tax=Nonomuraea fuscirosea TaxID=1291556 RepID=UPI00341C74BD